MINYSSLYFALNKCGIYKITNLADNKCYIGQSSNILDRWQHEINDAFYPNCFGYKTALSHAFRKYASDGQDVLTKFKFEILEECSRDNLDAREIYWISKTPCYGEKGYNVTTGGKGDYEVSVTKEWVKHLADIEKDLKEMILKRCEIEAKYHISDHILEKINKGVYKSEIVNTYPLRALGIKIKKQFSNKILSSLYIDNKSIKHIKQIKTTKINIIKKSTKLVDAFKSRLIELINSNILSSKQLCNNLNCSKTTLDKAINYFNLRSYLDNKRKEYRQQKLIAKKESNNRFRPVMIVDGDLVGKQFKCAVEAARYLGVDSGNHISDCCAGKRKSAYGYKWKYLVKPILLDK
jgi:group I intron endonuclease